MVYQYWVVEVIVMDSRMIKIHRVIKEGGQGKQKTEIWAKIMDKEKNETEDALLWWEDDEGTFHDESPNLPVHLRDLVDNAWIEQRKHL